MTNSNRKFKPRWLLAALLFFAWFLWQLFGPSAPIIVSKKTTYITAPLRPDGLPDYVSYLHDKLRNGVTHENNAAVLMWQALGPGQDSSAIEPAEWARIVQELNLPQVDPAKYVAEPDHQELTDRVDRWIIAHDAAWKHAFASPPAVQEGDALPSSFGYDVIAIAQVCPWQRDQLPPLAEWLDAHREAIDLLVAASRRPKLFTPLESSEASDEESELITLALDGIQRARSNARILATRAMFRIGEKHYAESWQDILAMHRWARLISQGPTLVEQLVAVAIDGIAASLTQTLLNEQLPIELAHEIQHEFLALGSPSNMARSFDEGERLYFLDAVGNYSRKGIGTYYDDNFRWNLETGAVEMPAWQINALNSISADWNQCLIKGNRLYDQLAAATRLTAYEDRQRELKRIAAENHDVHFPPDTVWNWLEAAINSDKRSEMLATLVVATQSSSLYGASDVQDRADTALSLTQLAAALAVYRADHGQYPDRLDQLVSDVLSELPVDLYHNKPFVYHRDADGYLLYSCGPNGIDDDGSNELQRVLAGRHSYDMDRPSEEMSKQIPAGADDISIRVPRPPFKLPAPPARN